jgi:hypothetical protein
VHILGAMEQGFQVNQYFPIHSYIYIGGTFSQKLNILYEYLMQHLLKLGGTNYHFKWVIVPGTTPY